MNLATFDFDYDLSKDLKITTWMNCYIIVKYDLGDQTLDFYIPREGDLQQHHWRDMAFNTPPYSLMQWHHVSDCLNLKSFLQSKCWWENYRKKIILLVSGVLSNILVTSHPTVLYRQYKLQQYIQYHCGLTIWGI